MSEDQQVLGLDASEYIAAIEKIADANNRLNKEMTVLARGLVSTDALWNTNQIKIRDFNQEFGNIEATLVKVKGQWKSIQEGVDLTTQAYLNQIRVAKELGALQERQATRKGYSDPTATGNISISGAPLPGNLRRNADIQTLDNTFVARQKANDAQFEISQKNRVAAAERAGQQLANVFQRIADAEERQINRRRVMERDETIFGLNQRTLGTSTRTNKATPGEIGAVTNVTGRLAAMVEQGKIGGQQILNIFDQISSGARHTYTGVENQVAGSIRTLINSTGRLGATTEAETRRANVAYRNMQREAEQAGRGILLSWRGLGRLFVVQTLHTAFRTLINELSASVQVAQEFSIRVAEIRTISQDAQLTTGQWTRSIRGLSDEFGAPILDVAAGVYETISNQIAKGADATAFMSKAMQFGLATVTSTKDSVNLLSSALNAYQLKAQDVDRVSAILFKTIDLGRVTGTEMADTFGRVAQLSASVGIPIEELSAAIATLTINGVKYSDSFTLINGVTKALIKPSDDMKKIFKDWGVATGEAAISTFGFVGVLKKLEEASKGSSTELSQLFPDIRGLRGATGLTANLEGFQKNLDQIKNSATNYGSAVGEVLESTGQRFKTELNKIKNYFIDDFGTPFIMAATGILDVFNKFTGSSGSYVDAIQGIIKVGVVGLTTVIALRGGTELWTVALGANTIAQRVNAIGGNELNVAWITLVRTGRALSALVTSPSFLIGTAVATLTYIAIKRAELDAEVEKSLEVLVTKRKTADEEMKINEGKSIDARKSAFDQSIDKQYQKYLQNASDTKRAAVALTDTLNREFKERTKFFVDSLQLQVKAQEKQITEIQRNADQAARTAENARQRIIQIREETVQTRFDRRVKLAPEEEQPGLILNRIKQLRSRAEQAIGKPPANAEEAQKNLENFNKEENEASRLQNELIDRRASLEEKRSKVILRMDELQAKATDRETINQAKALARDASDEANAGKKTQAQLDLQRLQREVGEDTEVAATRRASVEYGTQQAELETIDKQLKVLPDRKQFEEDISKNMKIQTDLLEKQATLMDQLHDSEEKRAAAERGRFENLKTIFDELAKLKLPTDIKTGAESKKFFAEQYDPLVQEAIKKGGLSDQSTLLAISKQRANLLEQADLQVNVNEKINNIQADLTKNQDAIKKTQGDLSDAQKKAIADREGAVKNLVAIIDTISKFKYGHPYLETVGTVDAEKQKEMMAHPEAHLKELQDLMTTMLAGSARNFQGSDFYKQRVPTSVTFPSGATIEDVANSFNQNMRTVLNIGSQTKQAQTQYDQSIQKLNQSTQDLTKQLEELSKKLPTPPPPKKYASGGIGINNPASSYDSIPALIGADEIVMNSRATRSNRGILEYMNNTGLVPSGIKSKSGTMDLSSSGRSVQIGDLVFNVSNDADIDSVTDAVTNKLRNKIRRGLFDARKDT